MEQGDVSFFGLGLPLMLVAVAVALSLWQRLRLEVRIVWATLRAIVQMSCGGERVDPGCLHARGPRLPRLGRGDALDAAHAAGAGTYAEWQKAGS